MLLIQILQLIQMLHFKFSSLPLHRINFKLKFLNSRIQLNNSKLNLHLNFNQLLLIRSLRILNYHLTLNKWKVFLHQKRIVIVKLDQIIVLVL